MKTVAAKRALVLASLAIITLSFVSASYAKINRASIVAIWLLDEGDGQIARDASGKGNDAEIIGVQWDKGEFGNALSFVDKGRVISETFDNRNGQFNSHTYTVWLKQSGDGAPVAFNAGSELQRVMNVQLNDGTLGILEVGYSGMNSPGGWLRVPKTWTSGKWHHVAASYDGQTMRLYLNGKMIAERVTTVPLPAVAGSFIMGEFLGVNAKEFMGGGHNYKGLMDEVAVFSEALGEDDIQTIMNDGLEFIALAVSPGGTLSTTWAAVRRGS